MTALTNDRNTSRRESPDIEAHPLKGGVTVFQGSLVCLVAAGWAVPGQTGVGLKTVGIAQHRQSATIDGERKVTTRRGVFLLANSTGADAITRADIRSAAYMVDDQTVAKTSGSDTRSVAGTIRDVDAQGVWVEV
jgi:hypothetical protein